jgi:hypothetical protein
MLLRACDYLLRATCYWVQPLIAQHVHRLGPGWTALNEVPKQHPCTGLEKTLNPAHT